MFENAVERDLQHRLEAAGARHLAGGVGDLLCGASIRAVEEAGGGRFRVTALAGYTEVPGSYAAFRNEIEQAAGACGYAAEPEASVAGDYSRYVLIPEV